ncbi:she9p [Saccharomyces arboricola H-6]|uniref:Sensitive to high expression protein 9, mitochondrial n=1 Tax=Saccharomyces arboricola (strain H-6 / AS 2.3317 / CBS 10644) TaxID=1160507 RepID=J8Q0L5_SACAR|nr:she9p [Saccharomyces arboricola H-6]
MLRYHGATRSLPLIFSTSRIMLKPMSLTKPFHHSSHYLQQNGENSHKNNANKNGIRPTNDTTWKKNIEPQWQLLKTKFHELYSRFNFHRDQLFYQVNKAKTSIRDANKKLSEQENEINDSRLNYNKDELTSGKIEGLPSEREQHRKKWSRKLEFYFDSLQETLFTATRALNDVTGYSSIQKLKSSISLMEKKLEATKKEHKMYKAQYANAIDERAQSQREVNELLQRQSAWSSSDLERFTQLYKNDAMNAKQEQELKDKVKDIENKEEQLNDDLYRAILTRYHEEQIWSDKIRRTSTWGTFILMGMNIFLFVVLQLLLEPWKRKRLVGSFEDKVKSALDEYSNEQNMKINELLSVKLSKDEDEKRTITAEEPIEQISACKTDTPERTMEIKSFSDIWKQLKSLFIILRNIEFRKLDAPLVVNTLEFYLYSISLVAVTILISGVI